MPEEQVDAVGRSSHGHSDLVLETLLFLSRILYHPCNIAPNSPAEEAGTVGS